MALSNRTRSAATSRARLRAFMRIGCCSGAVKRTSPCRPEGRLSVGVGVRPPCPSSVKNKTLITAERDRPDIARRRTQWFKYSERIDCGRLVFIDETWTKTQDGTVAGWAPRGQQLIASVPQGHWQTLTFLSGSVGSLIPHNCRADPTPRIAPLPDGTTGHPRSPPQQLAQ